MISELDKIQDLASSKHYKIDDYNSVEVYAKAMLTQSIAHMYAVSKIQQAARLCEDAGHLELSNQILALINAN